MNGKELFKLRVKHYMQFYGRLRQLAIDWTVWTYVLIPLLVVSVYQYIALWNSEIEWASLFNGNIVVLMVTVFVLSGGSYSFLHPADVLYLWQDRGLMRSLKKLNLGYYFAISLIKVLLLVIVLAPIILVYLKWTVIDFVILSFIVYLLYSLVGQVKRQLKIRLSKWGLRFSILGLFAMSYGVLSLSTYWVLLIILITTIYFTIYTLRVNLNFHREIELDIEQRMKIVQLILMQSSYIGGPEFLSNQATSTLKQPWIFKSRKLFKAYSPEIGYQEVFIKSLIRNKNWLLLYVQIIGVGLFGILMFPYWLKVLMWLGIMFLVGNLLKTYWSKVISHQFLSLVKWQGVDNRSIARQTFRITIIPAWFVLSIVLGYITLSYWGILIVPVVGMLVLLVVTEFFARKV